MSKKKNLVELSPYNKNITDAVVRIDLITYFNANPHARDTINGLAMRINRTPEQVERAIGKLLEMGVLVKNGGDKAIYRLKYSYVSLDELSLKNK
ncbi:MAG: hypothetical protein HPY81_09210 [Firmicutes bacterium]|nr:hypothetical protein [Bacillota bacterium]